MGADTSAIETFSDAAANDQRLAALRRKVHVSGSLPIGTNAQVEIVTADGIVHSAWHDVGIPDPSLSNQQENLVRKFASLTRGRLGSGAQDVCDRLLEFDKLASLQDVLCALVSRPPAESATS